MFLDARLLFFFPHWYSLRIVYWMDALCILRRRDSIIWVTAKERNEVHIVFPLDMATSQDL